MLVDNGPRQGLDKFLKAASDNPDTVLHYEFMQDYKVIRVFRHIFKLHDACFCNLSCQTQVQFKHLDGRIEEVFSFLLLNC